MFRSVTVCLAVTLSICLAGFAIAQESEKTAPASEKAPKVRGAKLNTLKVGSTTTKVVHGGVVGETDDGVVVELTLEARSEQGVPVLNNIPYVNKLFKNVGVGRQTQVVFVPNQCQDEAKCTAECKAKCAAEGKSCKDAPATAVKKMTTGFTTLPPGHPHPQHPHFTLRTQPRAIAVYKAGQSKCVCPVTGHMVAAPSACKCGDSAKTVAALKQQLAQSAAENMKLKAQLQMQEQLAKHREQFVKEMIEARVEVAKLQAQLEFAKHREAMAKVYRVPNAHAVDVAKLRSENAALKDRLIEFAKQKAAHTARQATKYDVEQTKKK